MRENYRFFFQINSSKIMNTN